MSFKFKQESGIVGVYVGASTFNRRSVQNHMYAQEVSPAIPKLHVCTSIFIGLARDVHLHVLEEGENITNINYRGSVISSRVNNSYYYVEERKLHNKINARNFL